MSSAAPIDIRDELLELLQDPKASPEKYRKILREADSGKLKLPSNFESIIQRLEQKFKDSTQDNRCLVDLLKLKVVARDSEGNNHPAQNHPPESDLSDSSDFQEEHYSESEDRAVFSRLIIGDKSFSSDDEDNSRRSDAGESSQTSFAKLNMMYMNQPHHQLSVRRQQPLPPPSYSAPQYSAGANITSLVRYDLPSTSPIFNPEYQMRCLLRIRDVLLQYNETSLELKKSLEAKIQRTLGLALIPDAGPSLMPFIHFDEEGECHVAMLFDSPPYTPWVAYTRNIFGSNVLKLHRQVYDLIKAPAPKNLSPALMHMTPHLGHPHHMTPPVTIRQIDHVREYGTVGGTSESSSGSEYTPQPKEMRGQLKNGPSHLLMTTRHKTALDAQIRQKRDCIRRQSASLNSSQYDKQKRKTAPAADLRRSLPPIHLYHTGDTDLDTSSSENDAPKTSTPSRPLMNGNSKQTSSSTSGKGVKRPESASSSVRKKQKVDSSKSTTPDARSRGAASSTTPTVSKTIASSVPSSSSSSSSVKASNKKKKSPSPSKSSLLSSKSTSKKKKGVAFSLDDPEAPHTPITSSSPKRILRSRKALTSPIRFTGFYA